MLLVVVVGVTTHSQELSRHNSRALDDESIQSQVFSGIGSYSDMSIIIIIFAPETKMEASFLCFWDYTVFVASAYTSNT